MDKERLEEVLRTLGEQVPPDSRLFLLGGSALTLLGSPRPSLDIDFFGDDIQPSELHRIILNQAKSLKIQVDAVPLDKFIPYQMGVMSGVFTSVNFPTWRYTSLILTASH